MASDRSEANDPEPPAAEPPSEEERATFFYGLPSRPRLVARTDVAERPWIAPLYREMEVVSDRDFVNRWNTAKTAVTDALRTTLAKHGADWTILLPVVLGAAVIRPAWHDESKEPAKWAALEAQAADKVPSLLVGVRRGTCTWQNGLAAATDCRAVVAEHIGAHVHVYVAELGLISLADADASAGAGAAPHEPDAGPWCSVPLSPSSSSSSSTSSSSSSSPEPKKSGLPPLFDVFDGRYGETGPGAVYMHHLAPVMQAANDPIVRFLPYPGQRIQQVVPDNKSQGLSGTLSCYLRLTAADGSLHGGLYGLASRHVVIGDRFAHGQDYLAPPNTGIVTEGGLPTECPALPVSWGRSDEIAESRRLLEETASELHGRLHFVRKHVASHDSDELAFAQLQLGEACVRDYVPSAMDALQSAASTGNLDLSHSEDREGDNSNSDAACSRLLGHVKFSGAHGHNHQSGWNDWALIKLDHTGPLPGPSPSGADIEGPAVLAPPFYTNNAYFGRFFARIELDARRLKIAQSERFALAAKCDRAGFVGLSLPRAAAHEKDKDADQDITTPGAQQGDDSQDQGLKQSDSRRVPTRYVYKRGAGTGVSMGFLSPVEAVLRTPVPGENDVVSWSWPVLGLVCERDLRVKKTYPEPFSHGGDSGACVFDAAGAIVGMLDAGVGADEARRLFCMHPGVPSGAAPAPLPTDPALPPQSPVPEPVPDWSAVDEDKAEGRKVGVVDITLTTPIEWVLEDIQRVTGLTPTMP
ncbi:hypothetical protein SPBR_08214 [Sporothrix brasiliensis 5110]|uniref:Uncharacterized protein n=1 Tax=Sporothrix brasiliensis 5110 TaxID=1398154 RepID=A0A0C2F5Y8_9PEZI|nr:uncharacterized protein SPBR_08214 [Sporothrix brasiliensis 5110]KIH86448.1 hypothetical protein SPBR_08214 [Sporothrix brasiliensis 5110]